MRALGEMNARSRKEEQIIAECQRAAQYSAIVLASAANRRCFT